METIFAQAVADAWLVDPDNVIVALADTAAIPIGFGTIASRGMVTLSSQSITRARGSRPM